MEIVMNKKIIKVAYFINVLLISILLSTDFIYADSNSEYLIRVNRVSNCITVFSKAEDGNFSVPYKAIVCSTGLNVQDTPLGIFQIADSVPWDKNKDGTYAQYVSRLSGGLKISSLPYRTNKKNTMLTSEYNKLGQPASAGDIRISAGDAEWISTNCKAGTDVEIYDDAESPGPLGKPESIWIQANDVNANWDPGDPDQTNPWSSKEPQISGAEDLYTDIGIDIDLMKNILAIDSCGNEITDKVILTGKYDINNPGEYNLKYYVKDSIGKEATKDFVLTVKGQKKLTGSNIDKTTSSQLQNNNKIQKNTGIGTIYKLILIIVLTFIVAKVVRKHISDK